MWISYSDSEVKVFHPLCERSLNNALRLLRKSEDYEVIHHQCTGTLEMDFCVKNKRTGKYLCVIEVKRTPADVHSSRYQFQAMSYVQMNSGNNEAPFYILTNLEYALAFRYESNRPKTFQQMLEPGFTLIGKFDTNDQIAFEEMLSDYFKNMLSNFMGNQYEYLITLEKFATHIEKIKGDSKKWKSHLAVLLYEYIRGAFDCISRNDLKDIRLFHENVEKICQEASRINFKDIFCYSPNTFEPKVAIDNLTLMDIYDFGNKNIIGDSVSNLLHQIVSAGHEHEGEVPTDMELGMLVSVLARHTITDFSTDAIICDPAAGSGNLISSAIGIFNLSPKQILVNDINPKLLELLSLRLGLNFAKIICPKNSPTISNKDIAELDKRFFKDVKLILMNPPFVAGINCSSRKQVLFNKIRMLTKKEALTNLGQMPFECVFLELITQLVPENTTIACVFPKTHLMARGAEAKVIRRIILDYLGLHTVFTYPGNEIFDEVTKDTCVLIGKTMHPANMISVISSYEKVPNVDINKFTQALKQDFKQEFSPIMPGMVAKQVSYDMLKKALKDGWRDLNGEISEAINFVKEYLETSRYLSPLSSYKFSYKRGLCGNSGASDLIFFDTIKDLFNKYQNKTGLSLKSAMRNAKLDEFVIGEGDSKFLDISSSSAVLIDSIIDSFLDLPERNGRQMRIRKTKTELRSILSRELRGKCGDNSVLIPRNIRRKGRIYLAFDPVFVSTNFLILNPQDKNKAIILSTWMTTIFYQLICEVSSKDQEGARKMEKSDIITTLVPNVSQIPDTFVCQLEKAINGIDFIDLQAPHIREIDRLWGSFLYGEDSEIISSNCLRLLEFLANRRNS